MILSKTLSARASESDCFVGGLTVGREESGVGSTSDLDGFFGRDDFDLSESGVDTNFPVESRVECLGLTSFLSREATVLT